MASAAPTANLTGLPPRGILACPGSFPLRLPLLTPSALGLVCPCLRRQPQQVVPPKPDPTVASAASLPIPTIREAALTAIPLLDHLLPLGDCQAPELSTFTQRVSCRVLSLADRTRPALPRFRAEHLAVRSAPPLCRPRPGPRSRTPIPLLRGRLSLTCIRLTARRFRQR